MKTKFYLAILMVAVVVVGTLLFWPRSHLTIQPESNAVASSQPISSSKAAHVAVATMPTLATQKPEVKVIRSNALTIDNVDDSVIQALSLTPEEIQRFQVLVETARLVVYSAFASHGSLEKDLPNSAQLVVALPSDVAKEMRTEFYSGIAKLIGMDRMEKFMSLQNISRFESGMAFFGEFPVIYAIEGDGSSLANSQNFEIHTTVAKRDQLGKFEARWDSKLAAENFRNVYGAVAAKVLAQNGQ